jgi:hypothetical protein
MREGKKIEVFIKGESKKKKFKVKGYFFIFLASISLLITLLSPIVDNWKEDVYNNLNTSTGLVPEDKDQLNITRPRSGDIWYQGEAYNITFVSWYHGPETHTVMEAYTMDFKLILSGETYGEWLIEEDWNELANLSHPTQYQIVYYLWHIPETLPNSTNYQIQIRVKSFGALHYDYFSEVFTIGTVPDISGFPISIVIGFSGLVSLALVLFLSKKRIMNKHRSS